MAFANKFKQLRSISSCCAHFNANGVVITPHGFVFFVPSTGNVASENPFARLDSGQLVALIATTGEQP